MDCFVCQKQRDETPPPGGAIYCDDLVYASHAFIPEGREHAYLGWLLVEPRRHIPSLADLTDEEGSAIGQLAARLSRALKAVTGAEHVYAFVIGHAVDHLHIHLLPRYPGTPRQYWGINIDEWPEAPSGGPSEIQSLCQQIRVFLKSNRE
jgi:diadenosine tetraphosphate (Ap4A) HIT family hydrolase